MRRWFPPFLMLIAGSGLLSACARTDTYNRPYTWHPTHANTANIAAQVADPRDLVVGHGDDRTDAASLMPAIGVVESGAVGNSKLGGGGSSAGGGKS